MTQRLDGFLPALGRRGFGQRFDSHRVLNLEGGNLIAVDCAARRKADLAGSPKSDGQPAGVDRVKRCLTPRKDLLEGRPR